MSALGGIFKFDPRERVSCQELAEIMSVLDRATPDSSGQYRHENLGMLYCAFHTTLESHLEDQPLRRGNYVLTWDGRLDNREEIRSRTGCDSEGLLTDADLVLAAYMKWGAACFHEFLGDWALALWDGAKKKLFLVRDCFGVRTLFYRIENNCVRWSSLLDPLVNALDQPLTLDLEHIAGYLYPHPPLGSTPFQEVRSVFPAHFHSFSVDGIETIRYWALNPYSRTRYSSDADYELEFRSLMFNAVGVRLRSDRPILAELSGGIDSSSIVCVADEIGLQGMKTDLRTLSYYDTSEPSGDERTYFEEIERKRGQVGHHISLVDFHHQTEREALLPLPRQHWKPQPGPFLRTLLWDQLISSIQQKTESRVILSGLGGDELLGGVQYEAPELAEHLVGGRFGAFFRSLLEWSIARRKTTWSLAKDAFKLSLSASSPELLMMANTLIPWCTLVPTGLDPMFRSFSAWRNGAPIHYCAESTRFSLAAMLSSPQSYTSGFVEKRYPYLDRKLFEFLASIPRSQIIRPRERRSLMRRSLKGLVPEKVLYRKTKWFGFRGANKTFENQETTLDRMFAEPWVSEGIIFDSEQIRRRLKQLQHGLSSEGLLIRNAIAIEQWLRQQKATGTLRLLSQSPGGCESNL